MSDASGKFYSGQWIDTPINRVDLVSLEAARFAANFASTDLGLDIISVKFFEPGSFSWRLNDLDVDRTLVTLNAGDFDAALLGKACHPTITNLPTVWVRSGLSPALTAVTVLHEARHIWHTVFAPDGDFDEEERDAHEYGWLAAKKLSRFSDTELAQAFQESTSKT